MSRLPRITEPERSLVDEFIDSWVSWREACTEVRSAYERWSNSEAGERSIAFDCYRAALDREERAADVHLVWTDLIHAAGR